MNPQLNPWPVVLLMAVLACGLMACESEETVAPTLESTSASTASAEPVVTASSTSAAPTQAESATTNETDSAATNDPIYDVVPVDTPSSEDTPTQTEGSSSSSSGYWVEQITNSANDAYFQLRPPTVLDAAQYRNPDGTYSYEGLSFADCDAFGTYVGTSTQVHAIVTNCGTSAFP